MGPLYPNLNNRVRLPFTLNQGVAITTTECRTDQVNDTTAMPVVGPDNSYLLQKIERFIAVRGRTLSSPNQRLTNGRSARTVRVRSMFETCRLRLSQTGNRRLISAE